MNMQCLGEVAMVCLFAMKLREESWDAEAGRYGLSLQQASEDAVAEALKEHPPEVQKATVGLVYLMITSWNDTEMWSQAIVALMVNININSQKETPDESTKRTNSPVRPDAELHQVE